MNGSEGARRFSQRSGQIHAVSLFGRHTLARPLRRTQFTLENRPTSINNHGNIVGWFSWGFTFFRILSSLLYGFDAQRYLYRIAQ